MPAAPGPAPVGPAKQRSALSGGGGCDPAARVQSIAGEQLLGVIISTNTRAQNGRRTVSVGAGEMLGSFRRRRQRAVPRRSGRSRSVHSSCTALGSPGKASPTGGESSTDHAGDDGARVGERSHIRASTVGSSVIFTNTKSWRSPNHVTWGSGLGGDRRQRAQARFRAPRPPSSGVPAAAHRPAPAGRHWDSTPPSCRTALVRRPTTGSDHLYLYKGAAWGPTVTVGMREKMGSSGGE